RHRGVNDFACTMRLIQMMNEQKFMGAPDRLSDRRSLVWIGLSIFVHPLQHRDCRMEGCMSRAVHSLAVPAAVRHLFFQQKFGNRVYTFIRKTEVREQSQYHPINACFTVINGLEKIDASIVIDPLEKEMFAT